MKYITIEEASEILNVSIEYILKLIDSNSLLVHKTKHTAFIIYNSLLDYKAKVKYESNKALDELVKQAQELDMGY